MTIQELRFGNFIDKGIISGIGYIEGKPGCNVLKNKFSSISQSYFIEDIKPLELTEEWLLKLGFVLIKRKGRYGNIYAKSINDYDYCIERDFNKHTSYFVGLEYTDSNDDRDTDYTHNFSYDLRYVHQLQNLFFDLVHYELNA